jgi:sugar lactone lactonase YvrE
VSTHGEVLVVDSQRHDVQVFSKDGVFLRLIGKDDIGTADEFNPGGVCVDGEGHIFVCNIAESNVVMLG